MCFVLQFLLKARRCGELSLFVGGAKHFEKVASNQVLWHAQGVMMLRRLAEGRRREWERCESGGGAVPLGRCASADGFWRCLDCQIAWQVDVCALNGASQFTFGGGLVQNYTKLPFWRHLAIRNACAGNPKLPVSLSWEDISHEMLVLETSHLISGGSLACSACLEDLASHFWKKFRTKRLSWRKACAEGSFVPEFFSTSVLQKKECFTSILI